MEENGNRELKDLRTKVDMLDRQLKETRKALEDMASWSRRWHRRDLLLLIILAMGGILFALRGAPEPEKDLRAPTPTVDSPIPAQADQVVQAEVEEKAPAPEQVVVEEIQPLGVFKQPRGLAVGQDGKIYVADFRNHRIQVLDASLKAISCLGERGNKVGQLDEPTDVAVDADGVLYVADSLNGRIQRIDKSGEFKVIAKGMFAPRGLAISPDGQSIYVAETGGARVRVYSSQGKELGQWGEKGQKQGQLNQPFGIAVDSDGKVYVAERGNARIQVFDKDGKSLSLLEIEGWKNECRDSEPYLAFTPNGDIVMTDPGNNQILEYKKTGEFLGLAKTAEGKKFSRPAGIACTSGGMVIVADTWNHQIKTLNLDALK